MSSGTDFSRRNYEKHLIDSMMITLTNLGLRKKLGKDVIMRPPVVKVGEDGSISWH